MMQADVVQLFSFDGCERFRHAVDERLDSNEAAMGILLRFPDQMLGAAKTDFKPHLIDLTRKKDCKICRRWLRQVDCEARQQSCEQIRLVRPQPFALAAAEKGPAASPHVWAVCIVG